MKFIGVILVLLTAFSVSAKQIELKVGDQVKPQGFYSYNFGLVWVYSRSAVRYTVTNTGNVPLNFRDAAMYGSFSFSARHSCAGVLMPSQVCDFVIEYSPVFEGFSSGRFDLRFAEDQIVVDLWGEARQ